jgi:hypothetical protein
MAQRRWMSLSQIFVGPDMSERKSGLTKNITTNLYTTDISLSTNIGERVMLSGQYKSFESAIFPFQVESPPQLSDHEHEYPGRIAESNSFPIQSYIDPE